MEPTSLSFDVTIDFPEGGVEKFDYESVLAVMPGESEDLVVLAAPFGLSTIAFGLIVGPAAGLIAKRRGSWV